MDVNSNKKKLLLTARRELIKEHGFSESTAKDIHQKWKRVVKAMDQFNFTFEDDNFEELVTKLLCNNCPINNQTKHQQRVLLSAQRLQEYYLTKTITISNLTLFDDTVFKGNLGRIISNFIALRASENNFSKNTIQVYKKSLLKFYSFCNQIIFENIQDINNKMVIEYFNSLDPNHPSSLKQNLSILKIFLSESNANYDVINTIKYLCPSIKGSARFANSIYHREEIETILKAQSTSTELEKRNFAILLLIIKTGLRSIDVANLKIENLEPELGRIVLIQKKTRIPIILPLTFDVSESLNDYLRSRTSKYKSYVFISLLAPKHQLSRATVSMIIKQAIKSSKIPVRGRRSGSHSMRHSLVYNSVEAGIEIPLISNILGHAKIDSLKDYLPIPSEKTKRCLLTCTKVPMTFYFDIQSRYNV